MNSDKSIGTKDFKKTAESVLNLYIWSNLYNNGVYGTVHEHRHAVRCNKNETQITSSFQARSAS